MNGDTPEPYSTNPVQYGGDHFAQESLDFVTRHQSQRFFPFLALTVPHANNERFKAPRNLDSLSLVPTLLGRPAKQKRHEYLYWESHERGFHQAVRLDDWKAIRLGTTKPIARYDLKTDPGETNNAAAGHPDVVRKVDVRSAAKEQVDLFWSDRSFFLNPK